MPSFARDGGPGGGGYDIGLGHSRATGAARLPVPTVIPNCLLYTECVEVATVAGGGLAVAAQLQPSNENRGATANWRLVSP